MMQISQAIKEHIEWLCEDMIELNEASFDAVRKGELEWTPEQYKSEIQESFNLSQMLAKIEKIEAEDQISLSNDEKALLNECNEMDLNDETNIREHYAQAVEFDAWLNGPRCANCGKLLTIANQVFKGMKGASPICDNCANQFAYEHQHF